MDPAPPQVPLWHPTEQPHPPPTAPSQHHEPVFSQAGTQPSLLLGSQLPPFVMVLNSSYISCSPNLCFTYFPSAIICGSGVSQQLLELSHAPAFSDARLPSPGEPATLVGTLACKHLRKRQNWEPRASSWPLARKKGVPPLIGVLRHGWDLPDPPDAAQGWAVLKAPLWISCVETTIKVKGCTDYCISKGEGAG